ncbi:hypothetical protein B0T14DRAFT_517923 [Immersiella caudata]|uniref:F-box domain-containing protein n=1 Tax=Immersiella caudata TaxID=314043 RepID=A0AA39WZ84_9PEZI|nr:hypothetical protein B0T14DRAFT_517923 [Immersiella caudata]
MADYITRLPLEVMQRIASLCQFRDVIALSRTCRQFRHIAGDTYVLQWCFLNQIYGPVPKHLPDNEALRRLIATKLGSRQPAITNAIWARLAAAASDLPQFLDDLEDLLAPYESVPWDDVRISHDLPTQLTAAGRNTIGMLSTWTVLCSPAVNNFTLAASLSGLATHMLNPDTFHSWSNDYRATLGSQISFCLAMGVLGHPVLNNMPLLVQRASSLYHPVVWGDTPPLQAELSTSFEGRQTIALLTLCCLPWILRSDPGVQVRNDLPQPHKLPLLRPSGNIPLPDNFPEDLDDPEALAIAKFGCSAKHMDMFMCAPSWVKWFRSNVNALVDNILEGEWMGYVSTSQGRSGEVPPPSHGIFFSIPEPHGINGDTIPLTALEGKDGRGTFRLDGHVERSTGKVRLTKEWADSSWPAHVLTGTVTPLGFAGYWAYAGSATIPRGFMWLYKKAWVPQGLPRASMRSEASSAA